MAAAPQRASDDHLQSLYRILLDSTPSLKEGYEALPCAGDFDSDMVLSLSCAGAEPARLAFAYLVPRLQGSRYISESKLVALLFSAERADGKICEARHLTKAQTQALRIVAEQAWPTHNETYCDAVDVLEEFGLPTKRADVERLLSVNPGD